MRCLCVVPVDLFLVVAENKANAAIVKKAGSEKVEQYLRRISGTICGNHVHG